MLLSYFVLFRLNKIDEKNQIKQNYGTRVHHTTCTQKQAIASSTGTGTSLALTRKLMNNDHEKLRKTRMEKKRYEGEKPEITLTAVLPGAFHSWRSMHMTLLKVRSDDCRVPYGYLACEKCNKTSKCLRVTTFDSLYVLSCFHNNV